MSKNEVKVTIRMPRTLKELMTQFVAMDAHMNESDLVRDAVRQKIQKEAPELYKQLFNGRIQKEAPSSK